MQFFAFLVALVKSNQLLQAALVAAPSSAILFSLRAFPSKVAKWVKKWTTLDIRFNNDMPSYAEALQFITEEVISDRFTRNYNYQSEAKWNWDDDTREITGRTLDIGYGKHIGFFKGRIVFVRRSIDDEAKSERFKEHLNVTILARNKDIIAKFKDAIEVFAGRARDGIERVPLKINSGSHWSPVGTLPMRGMDTVFSANDAVETIVSHILAFDAKREWNHAKGLPHRTGIILYGPPGNGKSSAIHAVASATKRTLFFLSLAAVESDKEAIELIRANKDWYRGILVIEDIDAAGLDLQRTDSDDDDDDCSDKPKAKKSKKQPVSLSTILNLLDGVISPDGLTVIATTNHPESLDEALRRPGRFDLQLELGSCERPQFEKMANLFEIDPSTYSLSHFSPITGSKLRSLLLEGGVPAVEAYQMGF